MHLFGLGATGYMWWRIAEAALAKLPKANGSAARLNAKLVTARFFMARMLPETATRLARRQAGARASSWDECFLKPRRGSQPSRPARVQPWNCLTRHSSFASRVALRRKIGLE